MLVCAQALHSLLFQQVSCVVHYGGIGTTAEALRAGCPQLVVPFFGDQPDHATRITRLGVGMSLRLSRYDDQRAVRALQGALDLAPVAKAFATRIANERGVESVAEWI